MYQVLISSSSLSGVNPNQTQQPVPLPTLQGCSFRIHNQSQYGLIILSGTTPIDYLFPNDFVTMPSESGLSVQVDPTSQASVTQPYNRVTLKTIKGVVGYSYGHGWQQNGQTIVTEIVQAIQATITSGTVDATIQNASVPVSGSVSISSGSVEATIQNATIDTNIVNTTTSPAYNQDSLGSFSSQENFNNNFNPSGQGTSPSTTLIASSVGGYVQTLQIRATNNTSVAGTFNILNGSQVIDSGSTPANGTWTGSYNFGNGIANNGITLQLTAFSTGYILQVTGFGAVTQNAAPGVPANLA